MKDCVVLAGDARDANSAALWAASCARRAKMTADDVKALATLVQDRYVAACEALFGDSKNASDRSVMLSAEFGDGRPQFQICTDGAVKCEALGPACDNNACDGLTCFRIAA